jgi:hypothetical protein
MMNFLMAFFSKLISLEAEMIFTKMKNANAKKRQPKG